MRLWSIHPKYLDTKGLVAVWREALLAKKVFEGETKGYKNHPQLLRFMKSSDPIKNINIYLEYIFIEAKERGYAFDPSKFSKEEKGEKMKVTSSQINYELVHLLKKLKGRNSIHYEVLKKLERIESHPLFSVIEGDIETWEKLP